MSKTCKTRAPIIISAPSEDPIARRKTLEIRSWIGPLRMLIQAGKNALPPDEQGGANLDNAQQVITRIEEILAR